MIIKEETLAAMPKVWADFLSQYEQTHVCIMIDDHEWFVESYRDEPANVLCEYFRMTNPHEVEWGTRVEAWNSKIVLYDKYWYDICTDCKHIFRKEDLLWLDEDEESEHHRLLCDRCYDEYTRCACCGEIIHEDDAVYSQGSEPLAFCSDGCAEDCGMKYCNECGEWFPEDEGAISAMAISSVKDITMNLDAIVRTQVRMSTKVIVTTMR